MDEKWFTRDKSGTSAPLASQAEIDEAVAAGQPVFVAYDDPASSPVTDIPAWPEGWGVEIGTTKDPAGREGTVFRRPAE